MLPRKGTAALTTLAFAACTAAPPFAHHPIAAAPVTATPAVNVAPPPSVAAPSASTNPNAAEAPEAPAPPSADPVPLAARLTSRGYVTWIYGRPKVDGRYIGYIRYGTSVALREPDLVQGKGCPSGFFAIEPRGYVCNNRTVTRSPPASAVAMAAATAGSPGPYPFGFAYSDGAPMYNRLPYPDEQARVERRFGRLRPRRTGEPRREVASRKASGKRRTKHHSSYEDLAVEDPIEPRDDIPAGIEGHGMIADGREGLLRETLPPTSMLSFTKVFAAEGRTWLLSADQTLVPADRVRAFRTTSFHGVRLSNTVALPLAWMRGSPKPKVRRLPSGTLETTSATWPVRTFVGLTGLSVTQGQTRYLETREQDADGTLFIAESDATVADETQTLGRRVAADQKSIIVSISNGTLVAYEGTTPVYATLMSPGRGGLPIAGRDPVEDSTTPLGTYAVTFKDKATTMSPDKPGDARTHWIADVPHTQYFKPPFALHAAYWHERFGEPTSAGCINVSPIDAEALFEWSDPQVPRDWQGASGAGVPENGRTTLIAVRR